MKSCPTCNRTFEDSFTFCLVDGAILSAPSDPRATQSITEVYKTDQSPTEVLPGNSSLPSTPLVSTLQPPLQDIVSPFTKPSHGQEFKKPSKLKRAIRIMLICGLVGILVGVIIGLAISKWTGSGHVAEAIGSGALVGFVGGATLFPLLRRFITYVWKD
jgi:hypothetical protein